MERGADCLRALAPVFGIQQWALPSLFNVSKLLSMRENDPAGSAEAEGRGRQASTVDPGMTRAACLNHAASSEPKPGLLITRQP